MIVKPLSGTGVCRAGQLLSSLALVMHTVVATALLLVCLVGTAAAHTCIGEPRQHRLRANHPPGAALPELASAGDKDCRGGLCLGQVNGPHWHDWHNGTGNASYPVGSPKEGFTHFSSTMVSRLHPCLPASVTLAGRHVPPLSSQLPSPTHQHALMWPMCHATDGAGVP